MGLGFLGGWANGAFGGCSAAIPNGKPFRVDVISTSLSQFCGIHSEWRAISNGPTQWICAARSNFERKLALVPCFVLIPRAALPLSPRLVKCFPNGKSFRMALRRDLLCAPHGPRLESNFERKSFLAPCFVLNS